MISFLLVVVCYVAAQMLTEFISSLKIISIAGLSMDAGTLIYPITFTLRDLVHKVAGIKVARITILVVAGINLFIVGFFWLVAYLPADLSVGPQENLLQYCLGMAHCSSFYSFGKCWQNSLILKSISCG